VLFIPDTHVPYHSKRAFALVLQVARAWRPDTLVVLGDFADCLAVSSHAKDPRVQVDFASEIDAVCEALDDLDSLGIRRKVYVSGNHEERLERYAATRAPEIFGLLDYPKIVKLDARGWEWVPYREYLQIGKLYVTHDVGSAGDSAHIKARQTINGNVVIAHTHRMGLSFTTHADGHSNVGAVFGHLVDVSHARYLHKAQRNAWQMGFGVGHMRPNGMVYLQAIPILHDYSCVVDGVLYEG
jgi:hypothetical protein